MAKTYQFEPSGSMSQAHFDGLAHSLLFADEIVPVFLGTGTSPDTNSIIVTSNVESSVPGYAGYRVLSDDSRSEVSIDIATGKFVEGNLIAGIAPLAEIQSDVRNYVAYEIDGSDLKLFIGLCATTQSQDYTPDLVANSRVTKMLTPAQVKSLNL